MNKKSKNQSTILFIIVGLVIVIALLIPYTTDNTNIDSENNTVEVSTLACDDENLSSEHETTLNKISCEDYNNIINGSDLKVVLYARPTCGYCNKYVPILESIVSNYNIEINYFDTDILSEKELKEFYSSSPLMKGNEFGTPTLAIIKEGHIENYSIGYKEEDSTVEWLIKNGIINE